MDSRAKMVVARSRWRRWASGRAWSAISWVGRSPARPGWGWRSTTTTRTPDSRRLARNVAGATVSSPGSIASPIARVATRPSRSSRIRHQVMAGAECRIDPLVPEDGHPCAGGLLVQHAGGGAEERIAMDRGGGGRGFGVVRDGDNDAQRERAQAHGEEWALTRPPPRRDHAATEGMTNDERKEPGHDHQPEHGDGSGETCVPRRQQRARADQHGHQQSPGSSPSPTVDHESQRGPADEGEQRHVPHAVPVDEAGSERQRVARGVRQRGQQDQDRRREGQRAPREVPRRTRDRASRRNARQPARPTSPRAASVACVAGHVR